MPSAEFKGWICDFIRHRPTAKLVSIGSNLSSLTLNSLERKIFSMDDFMYYLCLISFLLLFHKFLSLLSPKNQPPSPFALPIIGHLHLLKKPLHRTLQSLTHKYGHVILLRFGFRNVLIVSSSTAAEECFTTNDIAFANRPLCVAGQLLGQNYRTISWAPYGDHWRTLRRVTATEIFSANRVLASSCFREEEVKCLIKQLFIRGEGKVDLKSTFFELIFNIMNRMVTGEQCFREGMDVDQKEKLKEVLQKNFVTSMSMNLVDLFPILKLFGFLKLDKKVVGLHRSRDKYLQVVLKEVKGKGNDGVVEEADDSKIKTLGEAFLSLQRAEPEFYTDELIKGLITVMLAAGTDTSASTLEWAMSLLMNHPDVLERARAEIDSQVQHNHLLNDSDLPNLPYLHCIIKETMRMYPAGPLLVPHAASKDCTVSGYKVRRGTMLMVNAWAIQRDPKEWAEPDKFTPDRFLVEGEREGFKFLPFGVGRRVCPGAVLGMRTMALVLGTLIQCFEWERIGQELVEMSESFQGSGTTMPKAEPLEAICKPREVMSNLLSQL